MDWMTDNYPDWKDTGKLVEVELENGATVSGTLDADDWYDVPIFEIVTNDGARHSFTANKRWRFIEEHQLTPAWPTDPHP